jgi:hypothetical protein
MRMDANHLCSYLTYTVLALEIFLYLISFEKGLIRVNVTRSTNQLALFALSLVPHIKLNVKYALRRKEYMGMKKTEGVKS